VADIEQLLATLCGGDLVGMRAGLELLAAQVSDRRRVHAVHDAALELPGREIPIRTYLPAPGRRPLLMWFHGGGYVSGSLDAIDPTCRQLAVLADVDVVSVGYRLAPEHRYPAALDDCLQAVERLQPDAVGGDSAGGGLAAAVAQRCPGLRAHLLLCPWLDATLGLPSVRANSTADGINEDALRIYAALYADDPADPGVSPLHSPDLAGTAPAVVVTAGHDPLRDEGERYVERLHAAGVTAVVRRWDDEVHGFPGMTSVTPAATESLAWAAAELRALL
jgi:acetyl esterase